MSSNTFRNLHRSKPEDFEQRTVTKSENMVNDDNGSELLFNIGPLFLHVTSFNRNTGRTYNYFYETNRCKHFTKDNFNCNISETSAKSLTKLSSALNYKKHSVRVNIYKEKCICDKHLSRSFLFFGSEALELRYELLKMLITCEDCQIWDEKWIELLIEQMCLFFCCIKQSKVNERLLDSAGLCAKLILLRDSRKEIIEFKYSYVSFHQHFAGKIAILNEQKRLENKTKAKNINTYVCGEEIDVIDGYAILSFETEEEMNQYTQFELYNKNAKDSSSIRLPNPRNNVRKNTNSMDITNVKKKQKTIEKTITSDESITITEIPLNRNLNIPKTYFNKKMQKKSLNKGVQTIESEFLNNLNDSGQNTKAFEDLKKSQQNLENLNQFINQKMNFIPIIHGCDKYKTCICKCKHFSLYMVLNIGKGRPLSKEAVENLNSIEINNNNEISYRMATIAACALDNPNRRTIKRILVPAKFSAVRYDTKLIRNNVDDQFLSNVPCLLEIDSEVKKLVNFMVDYVANNLDTENSQPEKQYVKKVERKKLTKVQRELCKLSASFTDEDPLDISQTKCGNESCINGCDECQNQSDKSNLLIHCEKATCIFGCICSDREINVQNLQKIEHSNSHTSVEDDDDEEEGDMIKKYQANIKILDGKKFGLTKLVHRSKRAIKLSSRFKNSILLDEAELIVTSTPRRRFKTNHIWNTINPNTSKERIKKTDLLMRRLNICADLIKSNKTLGDLFIWCDKHHKYNCTCISWVCKMQYNALIFKPKKYQRYLAHKFMMKMDLIDKSNYEVFFYDTQSYSARTYGIPINYALRNSTATFKAKRMFELRKGVISSTNSYIKMNFSIYKILDNENINKFEYKVYKSSNMENIRLKPENEFSDEVIDVCDQRLLHVNEKEDSIIVLSDSEEDDDDDVDCLHKNILEHIKSVYDIPLNTTETLQTDQKGPVNFDENEYKQTVFKSENILCKKNGDDKLMEEFLGDHTYAEEKSGNKYQKQPETDHPKNENLEGKEVNRRSTENNNTKYHFSNEPKQFLDQNPMDIDNNYDPHLENELIQLEDHPLKNEIYGPDSLPKLSLYCLTPGIGYLPIIEYSPDVLVVQDPVSPLLLHSFKNLNCANIWLNKFLKDFLVFESVDICLKWVVVKPGVIKLKKSLPFTPAILENSSIIITKDGELVFNKDLNCMVNYGNKYKNDSTTSKRTPEMEIRINEHSLERKRKLSQILPNKMEDIEKRRKIEIKSLSPIIVKRPINMVKYYPGKKPILISNTEEIQPAVSSNPKGNPADKKSDIAKTDSMGKKYISIIKSNQQRNPNFVQVKPYGTKTISPNSYKVIPGTLLIPNNNNNNNNTLLLSNNGKNKGEYSPKFRIVTDPITGASKIVTSSPIIVNNSNNSILSNNKNMSQNIQATYK